MISGDFQMPRKRQLFSWSQFGPGHPREIKCRVVAILMFLLGRIQSLQVGIWVSQFGEISRAVGKFSLHSCDLLRDDFRCISLIKKFCEARVWIVFVQDAVSGPLSRGPHLASVAPACNWNAKVTF